MFVKSNKNESEGKVYYTHHIVESYRDENGTPKHRYLANLTSLPDETVEDIRSLLRGDLSQEAGDITLKQGDSLRGAGQMAIWRAWKKCGMEKALKPYTTRAKRESVFAMVASRLSTPSSKLALKKRSGDTFWARQFSDNRLDEDTLYEVMDRVEENFDDIQKSLASSEEQPPKLLLYDITSTYFEGTKAEGGEYGHSRDKRWDRYQIVVGLVCDHQGRPLAIEVWPGSTADSTTVQERIQCLRDRYGIEEAIFVGDGGMYSAANLEHIEKKGMDYIIGLEWHKKKKLLLGLSTGQQELFVKQGVYEWEEDGVRYIGCHSEQRAHRDRKQRDEAMQKVQDELENLKKTTSQGRYYTEGRLREKVNNLLKWHKVSELWNINISPLEEYESGDQKALLELEFHRNKLQIERRQALEGRYVIATTVEGERMSPQDVIVSYKNLQKVENGFRHIKSFMKIRPIYHRLWPRIRAHVLICFLAYYLTWWIGRELREAGITTEPERVLEYWDQLRLSRTTVETSEGSVAQWNWTLGEVGRKIQSEIKEAGLWRSIDAYKRSATNSLK